MRTLPGKPRSKSTSPYGWSDFHVSMGLLAGMTPEEVAAALGISYTAVVQARFRWWECVISYKPRRLPKDR